MGRPRRYDSDIERRHEQNVRRKLYRAGHAVDFIAVDGEGFGRGTKHAYQLLGVGQEYISTDNPAGLSVNEIFSFLYDSYLESPKSVFAGFFLGYDFNQWFKRLPSGRAEMLLTPRGRAVRARKKFPRLGPFPVQYDGWEFDILGMKRFRLRREGHKGWLSVCDAGPFYQTSLMNVINPKNWIDPVVTDEEYGILDEGKKRRDSAVLDQDTIRYMLLENDVLSRLLQRLNTGFTDAGIRLQRNQWFGPGQAAQAWMARTALPTVAEIQGIGGGSEGTGELRDSQEHPSVRLVRTIRTAEQRLQADSPGSQLPGILESGIKTYYGGWFEIFAHGHIPGKSYEYDINSAYPYIASQLPCLIHGKWSRGYGIPGELGGNALRIVHAGISGSDEHLGSMLHRTSIGNIRRPSTTGGWYWQAEIDASIRVGAIDSVSYAEWIEYEPCNCEPPMRGLRDLYDKRLRTGKNTSAGKSYKLIYNSVYGKLAQSVGNPKYGNPLYASLITSGCRTMILDAIATHPRRTSDLLMVATDGVYFRSPHPGLPLSEKIGEWEEETHGNLTLFKPGVYWDDKTRAQIAAEESPVFKARGISAKQFAGSIAGVDHEFSLWSPDAYPSERDPDNDRTGWYPKVRFQSGFSMVTCLQALQRGKWFLAGAVGDVELVQDADPVTKRHSGYYRDGVFWSCPYADGGPKLESYPYDKRFGTQDPEEYGYSPDGAVLNTWKGMLSAGRDL